MASPTLQITSLDEDFLQKSDTDITYNGDGSINTVVLKKFVSSTGIKKKTYAFVYDSGNLIGITVTFEDDG